MFERLKNLFKNTPVTPPDPPKVEQAPKKKGSGKSKPELTPKEVATSAGEPWVSIVKVEVDPANINAGSFELDWNDKFVINLIKAGYKQRPDDTDAVVVDRWFQTVCRNIALEVYEQSVADPANRELDGELRRVKNRNIGGGRTEVS